MHVQGNVTSVSGAAIPRMAYLSSEQQVTVQFIFVFACLLGHIDSEAVLMQHLPMLERDINLSDLLPYLHRHGVLTKQEGEVLLNDAVTHHDRVLKLLSFIEVGGSSVYKRFLQALQDESTHLGHRELVGVLTAIRTRESISGQEIIGMLTTLCRSADPSSFIFWCTRPSSVLCPSV